MKFLPDNHKPQPSSSFRAGDVNSGYYIDLTAHALSTRTPGDALMWLEVLEARRHHTYPVPIIQLGLGAWQLSHKSPEWLSVASAVARWAVLDMDANGLFQHWTDLSHTYDVLAPWASAMPQGQAASLLTRMHQIDPEGYWLVEAERAARPLLPQSGSDLVFESEDGPVLEEYPAAKPPHVLNGWIWALFGLHDVWATTGSDEFSQAWLQGCHTLARRLNRYDTSYGWSRYDLNGAGPINVASPFYHQLHSNQLRAMWELCPLPEFRSFAGRWEAASLRRSALARATAEKIAFRIARPKWSA